MRGSPSTASRISVNCFGDRCLMSVFAFVFFAFGKVRTFVGFSEIHFRRMHLSKKYPRVRASFLAVAMDLVVHNGFPFFLRRVSLYGARGSSHERRNSNT